MFSVLGIANILVVCNFDDSFENFQEVQLYSMGTELKYCMPTYIVAVCVKTAIQIFSMTV